MVKGHISENKSYTFLNYLYNNCTLPNQSSRSCYNASHQHLWGLLLPLPALIFPPIQIHKISLCLYRTLAWCSLADTNPFIPYNQSLAQLPDLTFSPPFIIYSTIKLVLFPSKTISNPIAIPCRYTSEECNILRKRDIFFYKLGNQIEKLIQIILCWSSL